MRSGSGDYVVCPQVDVSDYGLSYNCWNDVSDADAALIEAAPYLLAALKALVDPDLTYNGASIVIPTASHADAIRLAVEARSAISRATGEQS